MKKVIIALLILHSAFCILNSCYAQSWQWAVQIGAGTVPQNSYIPDETITEMAADAQGNVYACGRICNGATINGVPISTYGAVSYGYADMFVAKFNCAGQLVWIRTAGGSFDDEPRSMALDPTGFIYLTGQVRVGPSGTFNLFGSFFTDPNTIEFFVTKLDTSGNTVWNKTSTGTPISFGLSFSAGRKVIMDDQHQLRVPFWTVYKMVYGPDTIEPGAYMATLDTAGNMLNYFFTDSGRAGHFKDFVMDKVTNDYYIAYAVNNTDSLLIGTQLVKSLSPAYDFFLAKFNSSGVFQWLEQKTDTVYNSRLMINKLCMDGSNVLLGSQITNGIVFGNDTTNNLNVLHPYEYYPYIASVNAQGQGQWVRTVDSQGSSILTGGIVKKNNGNIAFSGWYSYPGTIGSFTLPASTGNSDYFLAELDASHNYINAVTLPMSGTNDFPSAMAVDGSDNVFIGGSFGFQGVINGVTYTREGGNADAFIVKYGSGTGCTVGINEMAATANDVNLYPNPVSDELNLHSSSTMKRIEVFNSMGQLCMSMEANRALLFKTKTGHLPAGIYVVNIQTEKGMKAVRMVKM